MFLAKFLRLRRQEKTFLEQINPILRLANVYGTALFTLSEKSAMIGILLSIPLQIVYLACCINFSEILNMFRSMSKFEQAADMLFFALGISSTLLRPIYSFAQRNKHQQIVLNLHKMNCSLGISQRKRFVPNVLFTNAILLIIFISCLYMVFLIKLQLINPTISNIIIFLVPLHANIVTYFVDKTIGEELRNLFEVLNENIKTCEVGVNHNTMKSIELIIESTNIHRELVRLSLEFTRLSSTPLLVNLGLTILLTICLMHTCIIVIMLQTTYYKYVLVTTLWRMFLSLVYLKVVTDIWDRLSNEVTYCCSKEKC